MVDIHFTNVVPTILYVFAACLMLFGVFFAFKASAAGGGFFIAIAAIIAATAYLMSE